MYKVVSLFTLLFLFSACGLFGIHFNVHNPSGKVKYPKFDKERILLGELTPIRENFDVIFYDLDILIDHTNKQLGGWVQMNANAREDIDSIQLDLDQPLEIEAICWGNRKGDHLKYQREERAVFIALPEQVQKGSTFTVHVKYKGSPIVAKKPPWSGGVVWEEDDDENPWLGVACEADGSSLWFPCKDHTADEPDSVHLRFTTPDTNLTVVSNGQFVSSEKTQATKSFNWKVTYPINLYNITYYVGNYVKIEDTYLGIDNKNLDLTHFVLEKNKKKAIKHFEQVKNHIRVYEKLYGEYPWYNDGFKLVESPYAGMEHQSAIAYGNSYQNDMNGTDDYIIVHETGHEWFGNAISAADLADVWLHEGFTTYGESLYLEEEYGSSVAYSHMLWYRYSIKNKRPVVGPYGRRFFDYKDSDVYVKGAWILRSLRNTIDNDSLFFAAIRQFYNEYKLETTDSKAFIKVVNEVTGEDYDWFFNQYLYKNKVPFLEYTLTKEGVLYYRWAFVSEDFKELPAEIKLGNYKNESIQLYPTKKIQKLKVADEKTDIFIINRYTLFGKNKKRKLKRLFAKENK